MEIFEFQHDRGRDEQFIVFNPALCGGTQFLNEAVVQEDRDVGVQIGDAHNERSSRFHPFRNSAINSGSDSTIDARST
jgi:hypothetical protein